MRRNESQLILIEFGKVLFLSIKFIYILYSSVILFVFNTFLFSFLKFVLVILMLQLILFQLYFN